MKTLISQYQGVESSKWIKFLSRSRCCRLSFQLSFIMLAYLEREGMPIGANDLLIAAHGLALNLTVVTAHIPLVMEA